MPDDGKYDVADESGNEGGAGADSGRTALDGGRQRIGKISRAAKEMTGEEKLRMKAWQRWTAVLAILGVGVGVSMWLVTRPYAEIRDFKEEFSIELPLTVKVSLSEGQYYSWQDGDHTGSLVRVYELSDAQFTEAEKAALAHGWRELPLPEAGLEDIFRRHISETAYADQLPWTLGQGLYMLKPTVFGGYNRFKGDETIQSYLAQQDAAGDVTSLTLGVLDPAAHKAYLLRYDD